MTGWPLPSNRELRRKADRAFKQRREPPPDLWTEVANSLAELADVQPREPPEQDAAGPGEARNRR
jgi:hypothetical protein